MKRVNPYDYIPSSEWAAIEAGTSTYDATADWTSALAAAGAYGELDTPPGRFIVGGARTLPGQYIHGHAELVQPDNTAQSILVPASWFDNDNTPGEGASIEKLRFTASEGSLGGYAVIVHGFAGEIDNATFSGLPVLITSKAQGGADAGNTGNVKIRDSQFNNSPRGGVVTDSKATDATIAGNTFATCGAGTTGAIDADRASGWKITENRIFGAAGRLISIWGGFSSNLRIAGNILDYSPVSAQGDGVTNYAVFFTDGSRSGMQFHDNLCRMMYYDEATLAYKYRFLYIKSSSGLNESSITHIGNRYRLDAEFGPATDFKAAEVQTPASVSAISRGNKFFNITAAQEGNIPALYGPE